MSYCCQLVKQTMNFRLCGSYASLHGGNLCDALVDFTSGLSQRVELKDEKFANEEERKLLRRQLRKDHEKHALMSCAISVSPKMLLFLLYNGFIILNCCTIIQIGDSNTSFGE